MLSKIHKRLAITRVQFEDRIRKIKHSGRAISSRRDKLLRKSVRDDKAPWLGASVEPITMPGMITDEEAQYYEYVGTMFEGFGTAMELGPWLGKSTKHIIRGLQMNHQFSGPLFVFDDFTWRSSWMDPHTPADLRRANHANFRDLFESFVKDIKSDLQIQTAKIVDYEGNEHLPKIAWSGQPIEIMYVDCGRTFEVNEEWYKIFSGNFIPDVTLLVLQDWGTHRERPRLPYNQMLLFTKSHPELELIHEVSEGHLATFLYRRPHYYGTNSTINRSAHSDRNSPRP